MAAFVDQDGRTSGCATGADARWSSRLSTRAARCRTFCPAIDSRLSAIVQQRVKSGSDASQARRSWRSPSTRTSTRRRAQGTRGRARRRPGDLALRDRDRPPRSMPSGDSSASSVTRGRGSPADIEHNLRTIVVERRRPDRRVETRRRLARRRSAGRASPRGGPRVRRPAPGAPARDRFTDAGVACRVTAADAGRGPGYLNALPYNTEPGGETLRSFRGVVAHGHGTLLRGGDVRRRGAGAARLSAARPELRVHRSPGSRAVRLPPRRQVGIGRALARSRAARTKPGVSNAARAGARATSTPTSTTPAGSTATRSPTCASSGTTTGGSPRR